MAFALLTAALPPRSRTAVRSLSLAVPTSLTSPPRHRQVEAAPPTTSLRLGPQDTFSDELYLNRTA